MPRFAVTICDPSDQTIHFQIIKEVHPSYAVINHVWPKEIYNDKYMRSQIFDEDIETCIANFYNFCGWIVSCENLDDAIMKDLNDGDSSVSLQTAQS